MSVSGKQLAVGLRYGVAFKLNASGRPAATATSAYTGEEFAGAKAFTLTVPEPRRIVHVGNDRVQAVDYLPPTEPVTGEIRVSKLDFDLLALLSGVQTNTVGEAEELAWGTDRQGSEPLVGLLLYQQSLDAVSRLRRWRCIIVPKALCLPRVPGMSENAEDVTFSVAPQVVTTRLWGEALESETDGFGEAAFFEYMLEGKPKLVAFKADGTATAFTFPTAAQALDVAKIAVFKNGTEVTAGLTKAVTGVTFQAAPTAGDDIVIFYETA